MPTITLMWRLQCGHRCNPCKGPFPAADLAFAVAATFGGMEEIRAVAQLTQAERSAT
jgi:hypothetical protein